MNNDEIRIAVAEAMGWKRRVIDGVRGEHYTYWKHAGDDKEYRTHELPNYPLSLDACAEFEKGLQATAHLSVGNEHREYLVELMSVVNPDKELWDNGTFLGSWSDAIKTTEATALQRCEAFLRVKSLWVEGEGK